MGGYGLLCSAGLQVKIRILVVFCFGAGNGAVFVERVWAFRAPSTYVLPMDGNPHSTLILSKMNLHKIRNIGQFYLSSSYPRTDFTFLQIGCACAA